MFPNSCLSKGKTQLSTKIGCLQMYIFLYFNIYELGKLFAPRTLLNYINIWLLNIVFMDFVINLSFYCSYSSTKSFEKICNFFIVYIGIFKKWYTHIRQMREFSSYSRPLHKESKYYTGYIISCVLEKFIKI